MSVHTNPDVMLLLVAELWPLGLEYHRWSKFFQGVFSSSDVLLYLHIASVDRIHSCRAAGGDVSSGVGKIVKDRLLTDKSQLLPQKGVTNDCRGGAAPSTPGSHGCVRQSAGERQESLHPASTLNY